MTIDIYSSCFKKIFLLISMLCIPIIVLSTLMFIFKYLIVAFLSILVIIIIVFIAFIVSRTKTNKILYRYINLYNDRFEVVDKYGNIDEFRDVYIDIVKPSNIGVVLHLLSSYEVSTELSFTDNNKNFYEGHISKKTYKLLLLNEYGYIRIH